MEAGQQNTMALINRLLPAEMLERVFHLLPPRDLKAVVLVCRWWREVGEAPWLWAWVVVPGVVPRRRHVPSTACRLC